MKITITDNVLLTNDDIDNVNFVELVIDEKSETVSIDDLFVAVEAFRHYKKLSDQRETALMKKLVPMYECQSIADDGEIKNCTCGKCAERAGDLKHIIVKN